MAKRDRAKPGSENDWSPDLSRLPSVVHAPRTDAVYNCHGYLTKVPIGAIRPFIDVFTQPGERVVDMFAGSGMTGLAAATTGRIGIVSDISALGRHIGQGYLTQVSPAEVRSSAEGAVREARSAIGDLYRTRRASDGTELELVRTIWSFVYFCPQCAIRFVYFEHLDDHGRPPDTCPKCDEPFVRRSWKRDADLPVRVVVEGEDGKQVEQPIAACDLDRIKRAACDPRQAEVPSCQIAATREMFSRSGLGRAGIGETKQFFSPRNAIALLELWRAIDRVRDERVRKKLRFAFTACLARASRRYQWGPKRPLNAQNQTYYIAPVYFEWNVFELFARKVEAALRSDELLFEQAPLFLRSYSSQAEYHSASADDLAHLKKESVDYVFCDPPFGSNIFYADMNLFHEAWLGEVTNDDREAVMHTTGPRKKDSRERYEAILRGAFAEAFRVLKPGRFMSVVFGNSSGGVWGLVQRALRDAGFLDPIHVAILDKGQRSVKGLNSGSESVVTVDLVLTVQKPGVGSRRRAVQPGGKPNLVSEVLVAAAQHLDREQARNPSYVYAAAMREAIRRGATLDNLHYSDVLLGLRQLGFALDPKKGVLDRPLTADAVRNLRS